MYDAWEIDNKCYSALETIALQSPTTNIKEELFEHNVSRAYIFMKLSETRYVPSFNHFQVTDKVIFVGQKCTVRIWLLTYRIS